MSHEQQAIWVSGLKKGYQDKEILKNVTFSVPRGMIYALLGSNGAGKTTTIRILTTQLCADAGDIKIGGFCAAENPHKIHEIISLTGQFSAVDESLTGKENLMLMARLRHLADPEHEALRLLNYFDLPESAHKTAGSYSGGMKRKLDIAMSLIGNPKIIFLDEPTTGLDPQSRRLMWQMIRRLNRTGITIFLTTQYLEEAEQLADRIAILNHGEIIAEGTNDELKTYLPSGAVWFMFENKELLWQAKSLLDTYRTSVSQEECKLTVFTDGRADTLTELFSVFYHNHIRIQDFSQITPNLEDVFLTMISEREDCTNETKRQ